jgi:hypothetical protein
VDAARTAAERCCAILGPGPGDLGPARDVATGIRTISFDQ